jgi:hypothetical protein
LYECVTASITRDWLPCVSTFRAEAATLMCALPADGMTGKSFSTVPTAPPCTTNAASAASDPPACPSTAATAATTTLASAELRQLEQTRQLLLARLPVWKEQLLMACADTMNPLVAEALRTGGLTYCWEQYVRPLLPKSAISAAVTVTNMSRWFLSASASCPATIVLMDKLAKRLAAPLINE